MGIQQINSDNMHQAFVHVHTLCVLSGRKDLDWSMGEWVSSNHVQHRSRSTEGLPPVGGAKVQDLLRHFTTLLAVFNASIPEICEVKGISKQTAQKIYDASRVQWSDRKNSKSHGHRNSDSRNMEVSCLKHECSSQDSISIRVVLRTKIGISDCWSEPK